MHKTANVLDKLPNSVQGRAKELLHDIYLAPGRQDALKAYERFLTQYQLKYPKACECLEKDKDTLLLFLSVPGRTLGAPAHHQPHRIDLRDRPASDESGPKAAAHGLLR